MSLSDSVTPWSTTAKLQPSRPSPALVLSASLLNSSPSSAQDPSTSATPPGETITQSSALLASKLDSTVTTSPPLKVLTSRVCSPTFQLLPLAHASCSTPALTIPPALTPPLTNGKKSLRSARRTSFTPSSTPLIKASLQVISMLMPRVSATSLPKASK